MHSSVLVLIALQTHTHTHTHTTCTLYTTLSTQNLLKMALHDIASESLSGEGTRNVPRSDHPQGDDSRCLDTSSYCLSINFCNIRGLRSNFQSVEHHLSSAKPHLLFLTETQVSVATDSRPFSVPSYFLYTHFRTKAGCCVYVRNDITYCSCRSFNTFPFPSSLLILTCLLYYYSSLFLCVFCSLFFFFFFFFFFF